MLKLSRQSILGLCTALGGTGVLAALAMSPALAGGAPVAPPPGGCAATATVESQWGSETGGGQIVIVTVANPSAATTSKWTVTWPLGTARRVVSAWNASVSTVGGTATAVNASYNGTLAPNASTTFGMQLSGTGPAPTLTCDNGSSSPSSSAPVGDPDVTVTQTDDQKTVTLAVGQTLGVSLGAEYRPPAAGGDALTQVSADGGFPTGRPLAAVFRAVSTGRVDVTTRTDSTCTQASPPCTLFVRTWTVHVEIVAPIGQTVTVTTADNRSTVRLHVGDTLVVSLPSLYVPPKLSTTGVLTPKDSDGGYPTNRPLVARYTATAAGTVVVSTVTDSACNHQATPCPSPQIPWSVTAIVTA